MERAEVGLGQAKRILQMGKLANRLLARHWRVQLVIVILVILQGTFPYLATLNNQDLRIHADEEPNPLTKQKTQIRHPSPNHEGGGIPS